MQKQKKIVNKQKGMKGIKSKIQNITIMLVAVSLVIVGALSCYLNYVSVESTLKDSMQVTARTVADQVKYRLKATMNTVEVLGTLARLSNKELSVQEKKGILETYQEKYSWRSIDLIDENGYSCFNNGVNVNSREYYKKAMEGETAISDPVKSLDTGELIITVCTPLWDK